VYFYASFTCYEIIINPDNFHRSLQATVSGLHPNQPPSVRISAVRAVYGFCEHLKATSSTYVLQPYLDTMMEGLLAIATQFSSEVLALCLETMCVVLAVGVITNCSHLVVFSFHIILHLY
jgi:hypothetical protein